MIYINKNKKNEFNFLEWNAKIIQHPLDLLNFLNNLNIKDLKIKDIFINSFFFNDLYEYPVKSDFDKFDFIRYVEISNPVILEFENEDRLEIDYSDGSTVKIGYNSISKDINWNTNINAKANVIFSPIVGQSIISFDVIVSAEAPEFTEAHGLTLDEDGQDIFINGFSINLNNGMQLFFDSYIDYGVLCLKQFGKVMKMTKTEYLNSLIIKQYPW